MTPRIASMLVLVITALCWLSGCSHERYPKAGVSDAGGLTWTKPEDSTGVAADGEMAGPTDHLQSFTGTTQGTVPDSLYIDADWLRKARSYTSSRPDTGFPGCPDLIREFCRLHDWAAQIYDKSQWYAQDMKSVALDIDADGYEEHLFVLQYNERNYLLVLVQNNAGSWRSVWWQDVHCRYNWPDFGVLRDTRMGSMWYWSPRINSSAVPNSAWTILRYANGTITQVADIPHYSQLGLCVNDINKKVLTEIVGGNAERIDVHIEYGLYPSPCLHEKIGDTLRLSVEETDYFVQGSDTLRYRWNAAGQFFFPDFRGTKLDAAKLQALREFEDSLTAAAFKREVQRSALTGPEGLRKAAHYLIDPVFRAAMDQRREQQIVDKSQG